MNDREFLTALETLNLPHDDFPHRAHVRMAWLYLREHGWSEGIIKIRATIQHYAAAHGARRKYHETITLFWARLVANANAQTPDAADFQEFIAQHPELLDGNLLSKFYSKERLQSEEARLAWLEPDLKLLPVIA